MTPPLRRLRLDWSLPSSDVNLPWSTKMSRNIFHLKNVTSPFEENGQREISAESIVQIIVIDYTVTTFQVKHVNNRDSEDVSFL